MYYSVCDEENAFLLRPKLLNWTWLRVPLVLVLKKLLEDLDITVALTLDLKGMDRFEPAEKEEKDFGPFSFLGFLGGLIALLTPCVFLMIPLTVSFFTKSAK